MNVYVFMYGDNPTKYFYRNNCHPTEDMCFFSSRELAVRHAVKHTWEDWCVSNDIEFAWYERIFPGKDDVDVDEAMRILTLDQMEEYIRMSGDNECIIECQMDLTF